MPSKRTSPSSGSLSRLIIFIAVVLPEPEAPTSATKLPASIRERNIVEHAAAIAVKGLRDPVQFDERG